MGGITRDKAYTITQGTPGSRILYFQKHTTEAESDAYWNSRPRENRVGPVELAAQLLPYP